jgi:hypothetical protein
MLAHRRVGTRPSIIEIRHVYIAGERPRYSGIFHRSDKPFQEGRRARHIRIEKYEDVAARQGSAGIPTERGSAVGEPKNSSAFGLSYIGGRIS